VQKNRPALFRLESRNGADGAEPHDALVIEVDRLVECAIVGEEYGAVVVKVNLLDFDDIAFERLQVKDVTSTVVSREKTWE